MQHLGVLVLNRLSVYQRQTPSPGVERERKKKKNKTVDPVVLGSKGPDGDWVRDYFGDQKPLW